MRSLAYLGRGSHHAWTLVLALFCFSGCVNQGASPTLTSTPVANPIVVSSTPGPSFSPSPSKVVDSLAERRQTLERVSEIVQLARQDFPGESAVFFIDLESDLEFGFSEEKSFESASLMKLVIIAELHRRVQVGELELDAPMTLESKHIVGGSGDLKKLEPGLSFPLKVLAEKMITQSDNTATQMLTDLLTKEALDKSTKNLGLTGTTIQRDVYDFAAIDRGLDNYITAKDAAIFMKQLARDQLPGSKEIHSVLERQQRNDMIGSGIPEDVKVAHKTGELTGILHDVGIVYAPRGSYVLAMLSQNVADKKKAVDHFRTLSQEILKTYESEPAVSESAKDGEVH